MSSWPKHRGQRRRGWSRRLQSFGEQCDACRYFYISSGMLYVVLLNGHICMVAWLIQPEMGLDKVDQAVVKMLQQTWFATFQMTKRAWTQGDKQFGTKPMMTDQYISWVHPNCQSFGELCYILHMAARFQKQVECQDYFIYGLKMGGLY